MDEQEQGQRWLDEERDGEESGEGQDAPLSRGTAERSPEGASAAVPRESGAPRSRRYSVGAKLDFLRRFVRSGKTLREFCRREGLNTKSFCDWRRQFDALGEAGLWPKQNPRNTGGRTGRVIPADERRVLVEAFLRLKLSQAIFARQYGISVSTLGNWLKAYRERGPKGLEPKKRGRKSLAEGGTPRLPAPLVAEIVRTKRRFPWFGMRRVRDYLRRFVRVKVSAGGVAATLKREGIAPLVVAKRRRRGADRVRRFERARAMDLWQSDITSYVLTRHHRRVYLTVFLDDFSRYVVAFALKSRPDKELVMDALLSGIARFGKPKEVLTDQGSQYHAWRGKSEFHQLLLREGIQHVLARAHHPETLGKCERLWETVGAEFWDRLHPQDLDDARERLSHFFAHYNHFRPHQGIGGMLPADRFFGGESELRARIEDELENNELRLALDEAPRKPVFLIGQVGEQKVSLHGERGRLVIQTEHGLLEELALEDAGILKASHETEDPHEDEHETQHDGAANERAGVAKTRAAEGPLGDDPVGRTASGDQRPGGGAVAARAENPPRAEAPLPSDAAPGDRGPGPARGGEQRGAREGEGDRDRDPRDLARHHAEAAGVPAPEGAAAATAPAQPAGALGDDRGSLDPATHEAKPAGATEDGRARDDSRAEESRERSGDAAEGGPQAEAGALGERAAERFVAPLPGHGESGAGAEECPTAKKGEAQPPIADELAGTNGSGSERSSAAERFPADDERFWPGSWE